MLQNQKEYIKRNLSELIDCTICNSQLVAILLSQDVISREEAEKLLSVTSQNTERAMNLYMLLQTRSPDTFSVFLTALQKTSQSGPVRILSMFQLKDLSKYKLINITEPLNWQKSTYSVYKGTFGTRPSTVKVYDTLVPDFLDTACKEIKMLGRLDWHENIVRYFVGKYIFFERRQYFAVALGDQITIEEYFRKVQTSNIPNKVRLLFCRQLLRGMGFLHKNHVLHLNLSSQSIFICLAAEDRPTIKIGEFGMSVELSDTVTQVNVQLHQLQQFGAGAYYTPEVLQQEMQQNQETGNGLIQVDYPIDVFCAGTVLYYIISAGQNPFGHIMWRSRRILNNEFDLNQTHLNLLTYEAKNALINTLSNISGNRPNMANLANAFSN